MKEQDSKLPEFPTYAISLPRATERRASLSKKMQEVGLSYEIIDATDERQGLNPAELKLIGGEENVAKYKSKLVPGALGCLISHLRCYEKLLESDYEYALIVEDDVKFAKEFRDAFGAILSRVFDKGRLKHWHMINLGWWVTGEIRSFIGKDTYPLNILKRRLIHTSISKKYYIGKMVAGIYGTHGYLISRAGCRFALDKYPQIFAPIDDLMNDSGMPDRFLVLPSIAWQRPGEGDIGSGKPEAAVVPSSEQKTSALTQMMKFMRRLKATLFILVLTKPASYYKRKLTSIFN